MTTTLKLWFDSLKAMLTNLRAFLILLLLYALLLVSFYYFISTREATVWQVFVTYALLLLVPAEFFVFQATIIAFARHKFVLKQIVGDAIKMFVVTIPIIIVGAFVWWLMNKLQARFPAPPAPIVFAPTPPKAQPIHWPTLLITTLRFVLFGVAFPLATIHLWIEATARDVRASFAGGAKGFFARIGNALARAFVSDSAFVYGLGLILFVLVPYLVLFVPLTVKGNKTDFVVFILRLLLVFIFTLVGWVVTLLTLLKNTTTAPEARQSVAPGVSSANDATSEVLSPL